VLRVGEIGGGFRLTQPIIAITDTNVQVDKEVWT
jgi:hypothetical protein